MSEFEDPTLVDPDASQNEDDTQYGWDENFQRHIVSLLLSDKQFLLQSLDLIKPKYFTNKVHQKVIGIVFKFYREYHILPNKIFLTEELKKGLKPEDLKKVHYYLGELDNVYDYFKPGLDSRDYLMDKICYFAKMQSFRNAFTEGLKLLKSDPESESNWQKIYDSMEKVVTTSANFDIGTDYFATLEERYDKDEQEEESEKFYTGLESIDTSTSRGGFIAKEMIAVVAPSGVGKSVFLACLAATNICRGKKGVYITLELAEEKVADRMDAILSSMDIKTLRDNQDELFGKLRSMDGVDYESNPLVIKEFPASTASVNTIKAYLAQLRFRGYHPDFFIVDYVGEMKDVPGVPTHESREKLIRGLRGLAQEDKMFGATAMQPNRDAKKTKDGAPDENFKIDDSHLADSFGQIRPLDCCFSMMQTDAEKTNGVGRAYLMKLRDGESRFMFYLSFDKKNLQIKEIPQREYKMIMSSHIERANEENKIDHMKNVNQFKPKDEESGETKES